MTRPVVVLELTQDQERVLAQLLAEARTLAPGLQREAVARIALTYGLELLARERLADGRPGA